MRKWGPQTPVEGQSDHLVAQAGHPLLQDVVLEMRLDLMRVNLGN